MARHGRSTHPSPQFDRARLERATAEGRFQQALELAKQLYRQEPKPEHLKILKDAYLERARQQVHTGHSRDAVATLDAAVPLDPTDEAWLAALATTLAAAGGVRQALALLDRISPAEAERVRAQVVDSAIRLGAAGREMLPANLHADFDRIVQAFAQVEAGQDEAARETLQAIGLKSPFQEWKVLLRGLQAWYAKDEARALEIWQRLEPSRVPARLAAPFRARLEPAFMAAQSAGLQASLTRQLHRVTDNGLMASLRTIRAEMENKQSLAQAFRLAEGLLPTLRTQAPRAAEQLARCFYWAILDTGPDDITRYQRVFGAPVDDPHFNRLRALAGERSDEDTMAHAAWQRYEHDLRENPMHWPADQLTRARALVWLRMAHNAADVADGPPSIMPFDFMDEKPRKRRPLNPSVEQCFQHSIDLAPDQVDAYVDLVNHLLGQNQKSKAEKAVRKLLQRFPNHGQSLEVLAELRKDADPAEALELYGRALQANPLEPRLRSKICEAHLVAACQDAAQSRFVEARQHLDEAATLGDNLAPGRLLAVRAVIAYKAGQNEEAETLRAQANAAAGLPLLVTFLVLGEAVRLKLDRSLKARFEKEFKEGIDCATPSAADAALLARFVAMLLMRGLDYHGMKTHVKKVVAYLERVKPHEANESQWMAIAVALGEMGVGIRILRRIARTGQGLFPKSPVFRIMEVNALLLRGNPKPGDFYPLQQLLAEAEQLARDMPPGEQRDHYLTLTAELMKRVNMLNPFAAMMDGAFGSFFDGANDDDDEDDDDLDDM